MSDVDEILNEAIVEAELKPGEMAELVKDEANAIYERAKSTFVVGNPRVWWVNLKHHPICVDNDNSEEFLSLRNNWPQNDERCYFIPENELDVPRVFDATLDGIIKVISNSSFFEYNLVGKNLDWLIIENDHNELLVMKGVEQPL